MRAVIDLGSNSVLLLVGERDRTGRVKIVADEARITRIAQGVARTGTLQPEAVERTLEVLGEYRRLAEQHGAEIVAVATEGLRLARDRDKFLRAASEVLGCELRMISGDGEAELSYRSIAQEYDAARPLHVIDIGGASTELVVGQGTRIEGRRSHPIGSVRLTERFADGDPPSAAAVAAMTEAARAAFSTQPVAPLPELHGLAGTVTTAAALLLDLPAYDRDVVDGSRFPRQAVVDLRDRLARMTTAERARHPCLPPLRADVIVAGLSILDAALEHCGAETLVVRDRGLRYALL